MESAKVLIVEDELITGKDLRMILEKKGFAVTGVARSGEKAIELARQDRPDLVLMDIHLASAMDGIETARRMRENMGIPAVYLTAYFNEELIERAKSTQPFGYLLKPYKADQVCATLEMALSKSRLEKKLAESEARYRGVVEDQTEMICRCTPDCVLTFVNGAYARYWGKTPEEMVGTNFLDLIPGSAREPGMAHLRSFSPVQPVKIMEHEVIGPGGEIRWQQWSDRAFFNEKGEVAEFQSVGRDITERVVVEQALRKSEARYRLLVENANDAIVSIDGDAVFQFMNRAGAQQLGGQPEDFIGKTMWDVFPKEIADRQVEGIREAVRSGGGRIRETKTFLKGESRWYRTNIQPIRDADGHCRSVILIGADITERKQIEERLDLALKGTNAGLWDWYVQTGETVFNDRWAEIAGYTLEELEPVSIKTWTDLCHPDDLAASNAQLERHFAGETEFYRCECRMKHKDGSWVWIRDRGRVVERNQRGKPVRMTGTHVDITERKRYRDMIQAERDMAAAWSSATTLNERLEICLRTAIQVSSMDCGGVYLVDPKDGSLRLDVSLGLPPDFVGHASRHEADSEQVRLVQEGRCYYARQDDFPSRIKAALFQEGMKSLAVIPVRWHGQLIACLNVGSHTLDKVPQHARLDLESISRFAGSFVAQELQEEEIRQSWKDLDTLFNTVQDMLFILDREGNILHTNKMACERLGYDPDDLKGKPVFFVHPEDRHDEARAGEAGAGFAVVADEVRNLALRAAEAAKNRAELIEGTVKRVNDGADLVEKTNARFTKVAESATKVGELLSEISAASTEQAQGIEEVNKAVADMDKVTQQNAANAEESASASEEMNAQAEEMKSYVSDLVALVGGKAGQAAMTHSQPVRKRAPAVKRPADPGKRKALAAPGRQQAARKEVNPEEVIPLDDKGFEDFRSEPFDLARSYTLRGSESTLWNLRRKK